MFRLAVLAGPLLLTCCPAEPGTSRRTRIQREGKTSGSTSKPAENPVPRRQGWVSDHGDVLSPAARDRMRRRLQDYERRSGLRLVLLTVPSLRGEGIRPFSGRVLAAWGLGQRRNPEGVVITLSVHDSKIGFEASAGLKAKVTEQAAAQIRADMRPILMAGDYETALTNAFDQLFTLTRAR